MPQLSHGARFGSADQSRPRERSQVCPRACARGSDRCRTFAHGDWALTPLFLAQVHTQGLEGLKGVRDAYVQQAFDSNIPAILAVAVGLCVLAFILDRLWRRHARRDEPKVVDYLTLAGRQAGLSLMEIELVRAVTARARVAYPTAILLSPGNMRHALLAAQRGGDDPRLAERLNALSRRLFGVPAHTPGAERGGPER